MHTRTRRFVAVVPTLALAFLGACGGGGGDSTTTPAGGPVTKVSGTEFAFDPSTLTATADTAFAVELANAGTIEHDFTIEGRESDKVVVAAGKKGTATFTLAAGTYKFYCSVAGHEAAGMKGTLTVA